MAGIYKITNPDGSIYIGQTRNWVQRLNHYKALQCRQQVELYTSLCKYGWFNHTFEMVYELPEDVEDSILDNYEIFYVLQYKTNINKYPNNNGLNMTDGGKSMPNDLWSVYKNESRSLTMRGLPKTKEHAANISKGLSGRTLSKTHIENMKKVSKDNQFKKITQYSLNDEFIKEWDSVKEAGETLNIFPTNISQCLKGKVKRCKQFKFKYSNN